MSRHTLHSTGRLRLLLAVALVLGVAVARPAAAAPGDWTSITTPGGTFSLNDPYPGGANLTVAGHAAAGITSVDVYCIRPTSSGISAALFASAVPVSSGAFTGIGHVEPFLEPCRLRAVPTGADVYGYLGSYAGPIGHFPSFDPLRDPAGHVFGWEAAVQQGDGSLGVADAGSCGVAGMLTHDPASGVPAPYYLTGCSGQLQYGRDASPGGSITVDGHPAYLPAFVRIMITDGKLKLKQSVLTVRRSTARNGEVTVRETAPLLRCSGDDTFPPTDASCPSLVSTGVTFGRTTRVLRSAHQVTFRDTFTNVTGRPHVVDARYGQLVDGSPSDNTGYLVPGHGTAFGPPPTKRLSGFGSRAATIYVCYDRYSPAETPDTDKIGWTWSRPPSSITPVPEGGNVQQLQSRYLLRLPAHQVGFVGLALSERLLLSQVRSLAAAAQTDMVELPRITRPARNAHLPAAPVTLTGHLAAGGNGLPTSVTVNGHVAKIRHGSAVAATFSRTLSLGAGWHVLTVRARDAVGNVRTATVRVHVR